jgi:F-type H+-transporting ATPase subunit b
MVRSRPTILVLLLALVFAAGMPALAAAKEETAAEKPKQAEQPNIFGFRGDLTCWSIVVFGALFLVLRKYAWKPMLDGLQAREGRIRGALDEAQAARGEAQRLREQIEAELQKLPEKVSSIMEGARRDGQRLTEEMTSKARAEIQGERDRLRREIETARDQALHELWNQTAQLATLVSAKAIGRELSSPDHRRLVDEALSELRQAGQEREQQVASVRT